LDCVRFFLALSFLATTLSATTFFDPPNPTSATPVTAHVTIPPTLCTPIGAAVVRNGSTISITLSFPQCPLAPPGVVPFHFAVSLGVLPAGVYDVVANGGLDLGTLVVRDAAPPFEVVPNVVPTIGGEVHLRSNDPLYTCVVALCPPIGVKIDGQTVSVVSATQNDIVVNATAHAAGAVDVAVELNALAKTATAALDYFEFDKTPDPAFFEPVVFPALVTGAGAFGSQWTTDASMRNDNDLPLPVTSTLFNVACFPVCDARPPAHGAVTFRGNAPAGIVFYAARQFAPRLFFDVLARDLSRQSEALGTEIPVAREANLYDRPFSILLVPTDAKYRTTLRVFRTDGAGGVNFRIFSMNGDDANASPLVGGQLALSAASASTPMLTSTAIDLATRFPELAGKGPLRIEIGQPSSRAMWALVSVTNNETQHVTVIAPH
jgi:hypothetical protein